MVDWRGRERGAALAVIRPANTQEVATAVAACSVAGIAIVPQGGMKLNYSHEVTRNEAFRGLSNEQLLELKNYSHFRKVHDPVKRQNLEADDAIFNKSFLDDVITDQPQGCWSI